MKTIWTPRLTDILPDSILNDPKLRALAEALDTELARLSAATQETLHLPRLDQLDGRILDFLAEQFHIDFWEPLYLTDDEKKNLIRTSIAWHRIKGTPAAVEQIANAAFRDAEVVEWFDYGGEPYHFQIKTHGFKETPDGFKTFRRMLYCAKNVRSWCDKIIIDYPDVTMQTYVGVADILTGLKVVGIAKPKDIQIDLHAGIAQVHAGIKREPLPKPPDLQINLYAATVVAKTGNITVPADPEDFRPPPLIPECDYLRFYFDFKGSDDRDILLKNPHADIICNDIRHFGDFTAANEIFLNEFDKPPTGITYALFIRRFKKVNGVRPADLVKCFKIDKTTKLVPVDLDHGVEVPAIKDYDFPLLLPENKS